MASTSVQLDGEVRRLAARIADEADSPPGLRRNLDHVTDQLAAKTSWPDGHPLTAPDVAHRLLTMAVNGTPADIADCHLADILAGEHRPRRQRTET